MEKCWILANQCVSLKKERLFREEFDYFATIVILGYNHMQNADD